MSVEHLYLPISGTSLSNVLTADTRLVECDTDKLIALFALSLLPKLPRDTFNQQIEQILSDLFLSKEQDDEALRTTLLDQLTISDIRLGTESMDAFKLRLISAEEEDRKSYALEGLWNYSFRKTYTNPLRATDHYGLETEVTEAQLKALSFFRAGIQSFDDDPTIEGESDLIYHMKDGLEDPLHVEAYAGSGKSFLVNRMPEIATSVGIKASQVLVLTRTVQQRNALPSNLLQHCACHSYGQLAFTMMPEGRRLARTAANRPFPYQQVISRLGIQPISGYSVKGLLNAALSTLTKYCYSSHDQIDLNAVPTWLIANKKDADQRNFVANYILGIARNIWNLIIHPVTEIEIPVRVYHQIKLVALSGEIISPHYRLVVLDEAHMLEPVMSQILSRSPQYIVTFGDRFQSVEQEAEKQEARQVQMAQSFRSPVAFEAAINHMLDIHRYSKNQSFVGNQELPADIQYAEDDLIPDKPCAVFVSDLWSLWAWMHRFFRAKVPFQLITPEYDIRQFVFDLFALRNGNTRPTHRKLVSYWSYEALVKDFSGNKSFQFVRNIVDGGYSPQEWASDCKRYISPTGTYALGLTADGRNKEYDRIKLTSDTADLLWNARKGVDYDSPSALYIALTRARYQLILPATMREIIKTET